MSLFAEHSKKIQLGTGLRTTALDNRNIKEMIKEIIEHIYIYIYWFRL